MPIGTRGARRSDDRPGEERDCRPANHPTSDAITRQERPQPSVLYNILLTCRPLQPMAHVQVLQRSVAMLPIRRETGNRLRDRAANYA